LGKHQGSPDERRNKYRTTSWYLWEKAQAYIEEGQWKLPVKAGDGKAIVALRRGGEYIWQAPGSKCAREEKTFVI